MARCIDCGFCGFYVDLLSGLRWYEMDRAARRAFRQNQEYNPPGQNPGTGHWKYARCSQNLQEWADWDDGAPSRDILSATLLKERDCKGFTEHKLGITPPEHPQFSQYDASATREEPEYDVFLSHSAEDDVLAESIRKLLENSKIHTFATPWSISSGIWNKQIENALQRSRHLWLLLTEAALNKSVWAHQEFGYFYGHKKAVDSENADRRLHYFESQGNSRRPGMYAHFQGTPVQSFNNPVDLARRIAESLGTGFSEPEDPDAWIIQQQQQIESPPEIFDRFRLTNVSRSQATVEFGFYTPITLFDVSAAMWHPQVEATVSQPKRQVAAESDGQVTFTLAWLQSEAPPETLIDSAGRRFPFKRPRDPGDEWYPLYVTFEAQYRGVWGLVTYFQVNTHQKGYPDFNRIPEAGPFDWVREEKGQYK